MVGRRLPDVALLDQPVVLHLPVRGPADARAVVTVGMRDGRAGVALTCEGDRWIPRSHSQRYEWMGTWWSRRTVGENFDPIWFEVPRFHRPRRQLAPVPSLEPSHLRSIMQSSGPGLLWYTGAGVSTPSVPCLDSLWPSLLPSMGSVDDMIRGAFDQMDAVLDRVRGLLPHFYQPATRTHFAISALVREFGAQLATENLDLLHESIGDFPFRKVPVSDPRSRRLSAVPWEDVDTVLAVGLCRPLSNVISSARHLGKTVVLLDLDPRGACFGYDLAVQADAHDVLPRLASSLKLAIEPSTDRIVV